jgi:hypothetical protein
MKILLHLVEPKTGKRLKLGEDFVFGGHFIEVYFIEVWFEPKIREGLEIQELVKEKTCQHYLQDPIDPLGDDPMFNGRTYGNGRFILCEGEA